MKPDLSALPPEVAELIAPHIVDGDTSTVETIGKAIASKRDEAKAGRKASGIEDVWIGCEEAYIGIDNANRHEYAGAKWAKPMAINGPLSKEGPARNDHRSTVFVGITARYVQAGAAKLGEILLPPDDKAFSFTETPVPDQIKAQDDSSQVVHSGLGVPLTRAPAPGEAVPGAVGPSAALAAPAVVTPGVAAGPSGASPQPGALAPPPQVPLTVRDLALEAIEIARKKAKAAEKRIYDWMVESNYRAEVRKVIYDGARIGVGVLKAPFPKPLRAMAVEKGSNGSVEIVFREKIIPASKWIDPWNCFPDPSCAEDIHSGNYMFERDYLSARKLRDLKRVPGYIGSQIDAVLEEGPYTEGRNNDGRPSLSSDASRGKNRFEVWYYYGMLTHDEMFGLDQAAGRSSSMSGSEDVYAIVTLVNERVIRATINPLDSGCFPYHTFPWQRREGCWAGVGVAEQISMPQRTLNGAVRAMMNNAGKSAGSQIVINRKGIVPADGNYVITPDKIWYMTDEAGPDVRELIMSIPIENVTSQLMAVINFALQTAEEVTSIPLVTQGQSGPGSPETFGAANLQNNNANQLLRSIGYTFDDCLTEPVVRQYYEWLLLDPDVPNDEKGDFQIDAHGSVALVERAIQDQTIGQMGPLVMNPGYGMDPKKWARLFLMSKRIDPNSVMYTEEQQAKMDAMPPADTPPVAVAKIQADVAMKQLAASQTSDQQSIASEEKIAAAAHALEGTQAQTDAARVQAERDRTQADATIRLHELQMQHEIAIMGYASKHQISIDGVKAKLATVAMQLQTEKELNAINSELSDRQHQRNDRRKGLPKPPVQTPGRAADGQSFSQSGAA